jgi:hypothetical protein
MFLYVYANIHIHSRMYRLAYVSNIYILIYISHSNQVFMYVYIYIYIYTCTYTYLYMYIYIYIYIDTPAASTNYDEYTADVTAEMTDQLNYRELNESLKHFSTLQKPVKSYMGKINSKVFENLNVLPDLKGDEKMHMTFDIDHKHFLNEKLPATPTFRSKQQVFIYIYT